MPFPAWPGRGLVLKSMCAWCRYFRVSNQSLSAKNGCIGRLICGCHLAFTCAYMLELILGPTAYHASIIGAVQQDCSQ